MGFLSKTNSSSFHQSGLTICRPQMWKQLGRSVLVALAMGTPVKASPLSAPFLSSPSSNFSIGGYHESSQSLIGVGWVGEYQAQYVTEKTELQAAMDDCAKGAPTCDPQAKAFAHMIDQVKLVPDKISQIEMINAYVNTINEDDVEWEQLQNASSYHTLKQALDNYLGVCKERAELKAFAAEKVGFQEKNVRIIYENIYVGDTPTGSHLVTAVRIDNKIWIMNDGGYQIDNGEYSKKAALNASVINSTVETDAAQLNFSGHSSTDQSNYYYLPLAAFNATEAHSFNNTFQPNLDLSNIPLIDRDAHTDARTISLHTLKKYHSLKIILAAISESYQMLTLEAQRLAGPTPAPTKPAAPTHG